VSATTRILLWISPKTLTAFVAGALVVMATAFVVELAVRSPSEIAGSDLRVYQPYGSAVAKRQMPYRDFALEYPPGALPMFIGPGTYLVARGSTDEATWTPMNADANRYYRAFTGLVVANTVAIVVLTALSLGALSRPPRRTGFAVAVVALSPLLLGDVFIGRFDVWPAALTALALTLALFRRHALSGAVLGIGAATKVYPVLLLPVLIAVAARQRGIRTAVFATASAFAAAVAVFLPFLIVAPSGTWHALRVQAGGGLQIESLAASLLVNAEHIENKLGSLGFPPPSPLTNRTIESGIQRRVLVGSGVHATATTAAVLLVLVLVALWVAVARSRGDPREDLVRFSAAVVACTLVFSSVLSPQYLIWLIPLVPLVGGRRGAAATALLAGAAILTNVWFPPEYTRYADRLGERPAALLLARNLLLVATALVLVWPRPRTKSASPMPITTNADRGAPRAGPVPTRPAG